MGNRRIGSRSIGKHGAWLLTQNREEQITRQGSWTGPQRTPPNAVTSRTHRG